MSSSLSTSEGDLVPQILALYDACSPSTQNTILTCLLRRCKPQQLILLSSTLAPLLKVDFVTSLPPEISFKILQYLDAKSLCHSAQVNSAWKRMCDDDMIWHRMCEQHIDKKCAKCGWGLPVIRSSRVARKSSNNTPTAANPPSTSPTTATITSAASTSDQQQQTTATSITTEQEETPTRTKRARSETAPAAQAAAPLPLPLPRSWKGIYAERLIVERKWRRAQYTVSELKGHQGPVLSLHYNECDSLLMSGSSDGTIRLWNLETGVCERVLMGHSSAVTGLQFDDHKIVSCSLDRTIRIWNRKTYECIHLLQGHQGGILSIHVDDKLLASGAADHTIRIWNVACGKCFTLRGHDGPVTKVVIYNQTQLYSSSTDGTVKLWDLETKLCVRTFTGHNRSVQSLHLSRPLLRPPTTAAGGKAFADSPRLVTGSLDNNVKIWSLETGECLRTLFGHEKGVLAVASDTLRIVSGSEDGRLNVWDLDSGNCLYSIDGGHGGPVACVFLSDTKIISGGEDGVCRIFSFAYQQ